MIWSGVITGNWNARTIARELFSNDDRFLSLYFRSKLVDKAAVREAVAVLAPAIDEKISQAFEQQ